MTFLAKFQVSGHSMVPTLKPNQEILVSSLPYLFVNPAKNDLVAFKEEEEFIIKRVKQVSGNKLQVAGDNKNDSKDYGWIKKEKIIGKVIYILP